jgi:tetratricopeptide (TPR) repeat protein
MKAFNTIEEAFAAVLNDYGVATLNDTPRFIAILSDYAPAFPSEQRKIREFARANGFKSIAEGSAMHESPASLLSRACEAIAQLPISADDRIALLELIKKLLGTLDRRLTEPLDPAETHAKGMEYYRLFPKDKNMPIALLLLEEAWHEGSSESLIFMASSYLKGKGVSRDAAKGMRYLELAAENGDVKACLDLANRLWKGLDIEKDPRRAVSILKELDDPNALFTLGEIYRGNTEYDKAFNRYLEAANEGHVYAQYAVAMALATGQGVRRDMQNAKKWLRSAASLGHDDARRKLEDLGEKWA